MSAIGLDAFLRGLGITGGSSDAQVTQDDLVPVFADIEFGFTVLRDVLDDADRQAKLAVTAATDAAAHAERVAQDLNDIIGHTYRVVIPHSLSWLAGWIEQTALTPIRRRLASLESQIDFLQGWRGQIDTWRHKYVDPHIQAWIGFREWFDTWPQGVLFRWHDWFEHPDGFAQWAAPILIRPFVSFLSSPAHQTERDSLTLTMVNAWSEVPNRTWEAILRWLVTDS